MDCGNTLEFEMPPDSSDSLFASAPARPRQGVRAVMTGQVGVYLTVFLVGVLGIFFVVMG